MAVPDPPSSESDELVSLRAEVERLRIENQLLRERIDLILRRLFDRKSESLDPAQLQLLLDPDTAKKAPAAEPADRGPAAEPVPAKARAPRKARDLGHLEVKETVLVSEEAEANPAEYREIDRVVTDRLDYRPAAIFINRLVRVVHVPVGYPDGVPVKAPAPPSLGLGATSRLVAYVLASKYCYHRPHYRTQNVLRQRHGVEFPRNTLCHWDGVAADTCEPLYKLLHADLLNSGCLQADETPVRYLAPGRGKCATGYLWVIHAPRNGIRGDILYQWHPNRKAACLDQLLGSYQGFLQTDAYAGYDAWLSNKTGVVLLACWAHARRRFCDALQAGQSLAAGPLAAIQRIYQVEATLRQARADTPERARVRQQQSGPILQILKADLLALRSHPGVMPRSALGKAIDYTLALWERLVVYLEHGELEIDNNWIENGIRPTAIGKKNWLFVGGETTGQRAAILYTMVECARRHGHNPELYLADILERLPAMTNQDDLRALLPVNWRPGAAKEMAGSAVAV